MMAFEFEDPLDEYDLHGAEGGLFGDIFSTIGKVASAIPGPVGAITRGVSSFFDDDDDDDAVSPCPGGFTMVNGRCTPGGLPAIALPFAGLAPPAPSSVTVEAGGGAVMGQYGTGVVPVRMAEERLRCPRGMVLGKDEICYNKRDITKKERKWNPGRKPLFTGGDLNAISRAARLEDRAKKIAEDLGWSVRSKSAAASQAAKMRELKGARGSRRMIGPGVGVNIDN